MMRLVFFLSLLICSLSAPAQRRTSNTLELVSGIGKRGLINVHESIFRSTTSLYYNIGLHPVIDFKLGPEALYFSDPVPNILKGWSREKWAYGIVSAVEFKLNTIYFITGLGRYVYFKSVYNESHPNDLIRYYTKLGFRYQFQSRWSIGFTMRAHRSQADYIDFNLGFKLGKVRPKIDLKTGDH